MLAGCGSRHTAPSGPLPRLALPPAPAPVARRVRLELTIVNGDTNLRVRGAVVRVWRRSGRTARDGVAEIRIPRLRPLAVTVGARGYSTRVVQERFATRKATIRIYRPSAQWPLYGANPQRTQAQTAIRLRPPFRTVWTRGMGTLIEFPAVVSDGVAYIGNARATVRAVSMRFGTVLWRRDTPGGEMASSPAVDGPTVVVHTMNGWVIVLDRATGGVRWRRYVGSPIESSPIVRDGIDYFGAWNGELYALDLRTHRLRWQRYLGAKITSSVAIAGGTLYLGDYAGRVWALSASSGATRWVASVNGRVYGTPAVAGGRLFVPSSDGDSLTAFSTGGRTLWRVSTGAYVYSSPATWDGRVFFGSYNGVFYCVSAASGRILWEVGTGGAISGAAVVVDGVAYAGSFSHEVVGVDARSGRVLLRFPHGYYVPVSGNGMRLLIHGYSRLYAVEPRVVARR